MARPTSEPAIVVVHEFPVSAKPGADVVRATLQTYRGGRWVHLRRWYSAETDSIGDEQRPGKGLVGRLEQLPELKTAVDALVEATLAQGR